MLCFWLITVSNTFAKQKNLKIQSYLYSLAQVFVRLNFLNLLSVLSDWKHQYKIIYILHFGENMYLIELYFSKYFIMLANFCRASSFPSKYNNRNLFLFFSTLFTFKRVVGLITKTFFSLSNS